MKNNTKTLPSIRISQQTYSNIEACIKNTPGATLEGNGGKGSPILAKVDTRKEILKGNQRN